MLHLLPAFGSVFFINISLRILFSRALAAFRCLSGTGVLFTAALLLLVCAWPQAVRAQVPDDLIPGGSTWYRNCASLDLDFYNDQYYINHNTTCDGTIGTTYTAGSGNTGVQNFIAGTGATFTRAGTNNVTDTNPPSYLDATQGQSFVSRASSGTYFNSSGVLSSAATNVARSNYTYNGSSWTLVGTLIEPTVTNLIAYSQGTTGESGTTTYTTSSTLSPDQSTYFLKCTETTTTTCRWSLSMSASTTYTVSAYVTAGTSPGTPYFLLLAFDGTNLSSATVNLTAGTSTSCSTALGGTTGIQSLGGGVYRVWMSFTTGSSPSTPYFDFRLQNTAPPFSSCFSAGTGDSSSALYIWGVQLEAGATPTAYIPTTGSAVTRAADVYSVPNGGTYFNSSGVMKTAPVNTPRLDHSPVSPYAAEGVLIEESRTNSVTYSAQARRFFGADSTTISDNAVIAPDGTTAASQVLETTANNDHYIEKNSIATASNQPLSFSVYLKPVATRSLFWIKIYANSYADNIQAACNISTVTAVSTGTGTGVATGAVIKALPNGWYYCAVYGQPSTASVTDTTPRIQIINGSTTYTGDPTQGVDVWGAQVEAGAFPTSYIPTSGATVTRAADVFTLPTTAGGGWYTAGVGTLGSVAAIVYSDAIANTSENHFIASIDDGTLNNGITTFVSRNGGAGNYRKTQMTLGGIISYIPFFSGYTWGALTKEVIAFQANDQGSAVDGTAYSDGTAATIPTVTKIELGASGGVVNLDGWINRIWYMPIRNSDASLPQYTH
jgi:hypothetical protein